MITLTLLHPLQAIPVQSWTFEKSTTIKIGRSTDNEVVLYSAVVSRHHVEIKHTGKGWEVKNLGSNGTYLEGRKQNSFPVEDGMVIRLASSGPKIQITLDQQDGKNTSTQGSRRSSLRKNDRSKDTLIN